jgi:GDPmannose 4,6-dehydratase
MPGALITGVTGQDGWYLAQQLLADGWEVHGLARRQREVPVGTHLHIVDATDARAVSGVVAAIAPSVLYHLAADSLVASDAPEDLIVRRHLMATEAILGAWQRHVADSRLVLASSSEVFAGDRTPPQDARTPLQPLTPYGRGKAAALQLLRDTRAATGGHLSAAILYNHESERRDPRFLGRKVSLGVAAIVAGRTDTLVLGNLDARRDWGYAPDYMDALRRLAGRSAPADHVIGTGIVHSVREFCDAAFRAAGLDYARYVTSDPALIRATDPVTLVADPVPAARDLGWRATTPFAEMVARMVAADIARLRVG